MPCSDSWSPGITEGIILRNCHKQMRKQATEVIITTKPPPEMEWDKSGREQERHCGLTLTYEGMQKRDFR